MQLVKCINCGNIHNSVEGMITRNVVGISITSRAIRGVSDSTCRTLVPAPAVSVTPNRTKPFGENFNR